jgi:hypothetical protein
MHEPESTSANPKVLVSIDKPEYEETIGESRLELPTEEEHK